MIGSGSYDELMEKSPKFKQLLENIDQQKEELNDSNVHQESRAQARSMTISDSESEDFTASIVSIEAKQDGSIKFKVYLSYLQAGVGSLIGSIILVLIFGAREATSIFFHRSLALWNNDPNSHVGFYANCTEQKMESTNSSHSSKDSVPFFYGRDKINNCLGMLLI